MISGKFLKVKCKKCKNEQNIYNKATTDVACLVCGEIIAECTGGHAEIKTTILQALE